MTLPTECRHRIYRELLYQTAQPIWLRHYVPISALLGSFDANVHQADPIFQTQVFCISKEIHEDAVMYAYGRNDFQIKEDFAVFCGLSEIALKSIAKLVIVPSMWRCEGPKERDMWLRLQQCSNLQRLEIYLHPEVLFPTVRHFTDLRDQLRLLQQKPRILLDLCIWERHLSFDPQPLDYQRTRTLLENSQAPSELTFAHTDPRQRIMRLPLQAHNILLTVDVSAAAVTALDDYLGSSDTPLFSKAVADLPDRGTRSIGGRSQRLWYELQVS